MRTLTVLDATTVRRHLTMPECIEAMREAMIGLYAGSIDVPQRQIQPLQDRSGHVALMPASASDPSVFGVKVLSLLPGNRARGLPSIQGFIALFDLQTGAPVALVEGSTVTAIRTAAASGLATQLLARSDARTHGILGSGVQAATHAQAIASALPSIEQTIVWGRDHAQASRIAAEFSAVSGCAARATQYIEEVAACDVVSTVTGAAEPVLRNRWVRLGTHINLVGSHSPDRREADSELICRAEVFVDSIEAAKLEAGDLLIPMRAGLLKPGHIRGEIGAVAAGSLRGRAADSSITIYKSLGLAAQDLLAAWRVFRLASAAGDGVRVTW